MAGYVECMSKIMKSCSRVGYSIDAKELAERINEAIPDSLKETQIFKMVDCRTNCNAANHIATRQVWNKDFSLHTLAAATPTATIDLVGVVLKRAYPRPCSSCAKAITATAKLLQECWSYASSTATYVALGMAFNL